MKSGANEAGPWGGHQVWKSDLAALWGVPQLPSVWFETQSAGLLLRGRGSLQQGTLAFETWHLLNEPVRLLTHIEGKPWGRELWYTGIEKRGVSRVETAQGAQLSLAEYLALCAGPENCSRGSLQAPSLLKILDPLPFPDRGSLYIEVHREKWETYIVTSIDALAWPEGHGEILFGYSSTKMAAYGGLRLAFLTALHEVVQEYERIRREIDALEANKASLEQIEKEKRLWMEVREFFDVIRVSVGDVIAVPPLVPHSLQHGVRVVEFQTPTYERLILAFNQKVQTQSHWNTLEALEASRFESGRQLFLDDAFETVEIQGAAWGKIVDFPQFKVLRKSLAQGEKIRFASGVGNSSDSALFFVVSGRVRVTSPSGASMISVGPEESLLLPRPQPEQVYECLAEKDAVVLMV
jgi:hypothetical protein